MFSVRRAERRLAMATAAKESRGARQTSRRVRDQHEQDSMEFVIFEDNSGEYRWMIVAGNETLAHSGSFAFYEGAEQAARRVRDHAASALFDHSPGEDLAAGHDGPSLVSDGERRLGDGGRLTSEATARRLAQKAVIT
jgi:uncharacterized protein YegP (UPF0339 family)